MTKEEAVIIARRHLEMAQQIDRPVDSVVDLDEQYSRHAALLTEDHPDRLCFEREQSRLAGKYVVWLKTPMLPNMLIVPGVFGVIVRKSDGKTWWQSENGQHE